MAGDWIKMRANLHTHPKVVRMASALKADKLLIVGGLHAAWCLFDDHAEDGRLDGYTSAAIDDHVGFPGFAAAMGRVGWLEQGDDFVALPRFDNHNGQSAKRRATDADRKREKRAESVLETSAPPADKKRTREEKRREDIGDAPKARKSKVPEDFTPNETGMTLAHEAGLDIPREVSQFRDHHTAKGSVMLDWQAAFRTWVSNAVKFGRGGKPANDDPYGLRSAL